MWAEYGVVAEDTRDRKLRESPECLKDIQLYRRNIFIRRIVLTARLRDGVNEAGQRVGHVALEAIVALDFETVDVLARRTYFLETHD